MKRILDYDGEVEFDDMTGNLRLETGNAMEDEIRWAIEEAFAPPAVDIRGRLHIIVEVEEK